MLLICHFVVDPVEAQNFALRAHRVLGLLTTQSGCLGGELGRCPDDTSRWVLVVRFDSVVAYRRALSPFEVREHVIPLLSEALTVQPGGFEVLASAQAGAVTEHATLLATGTELTTDPTVRHGARYR